MTKQELARLRFNLVSAVTEYDRKQSTKPSYNMYALPQYLERVSEIMDDIAAGADPRAAITAGFTGTLVSSILRRLKMSGASKGEMSGMGSMVYEPVAKRNPRHREDPLYVKYLSLKSGEEPFMMQGSKYEYVWAEYPGGIKDIGVYSYANDLVYSYDSFRQMMNLDRTNPVRPRKGEKARAFISRCMSEEKASFPEPKQRIAVCLSKSRKRNPVYDTGSDE